MEWIPNGQEWAEQALPSEPVPNHKDFTLYALTYLEHNLHFHSSNKLHIAVNGHEEIGNLKLGASSE